MPNFKTFRLNVPSGWPKAKEEVKETEAEEGIFSSSVITVFNLACLSPCLAPWWWEQAKNIETLKEQIPSEYFRVSNSKLTVAL